ncbi:MAG: glycosyltransferase family 39 protein [Thermoanaerobaculales bacterium]|nr:glycosyltransferase family 39 protein [Thermoanaerobaculales bacterium]
MSQPAPSHPAPTPPAAAPLSLPILGALVAAKIVLHLPGLSRYGYFRDELYFLDCARRLDWGYVDCAPLVAVYTKGALLLGGSLPALRVLPLLAGAGMVALTVLLAARLGGGPFAQLLAGLAILIAPVHLMIGSILTMNAFEPLFWLGCVLVLVRIARGGDSRLWLLFGALAGLGLMNKHSTLFFGLAVAVGVVATPLRRELARPWIWLGAALALAIFLPNLLWQWQHGFPTLEDLRAVRASGKNVELAPLQFITQQVLMMHPATLPVWLAGLWFLLAGRGRAWRAVGWTYLVLLAILMALKGKDYYLAPAYPMLLAAGGAAVEAWTARIARPGSRLVARSLTVAWLAAPGAIMAPLFLPLLPPPTYVAYQERLGLALSKSEVAHVGPLPQLWGDQHGWPELVAEVAAVYHALPAGERARTGIFASNYGEAGALNLFGPALGLPPAICGHQTHSMWGPGDFAGDTLIWLQWSAAGIAEHCESVEVVGEHHHPWGMAEENRPIHLCRGLRRPLTELWPELVHWN